MIILLTGLPRMGKTTVLKRFLETFPTEGVSWIVSSEIRDEYGERAGFRAATSAGDDAVFARKGSPGPGPLMGDYRVDPEAIERVFTRPILAACARPPKLLVLDEIGRMQALSPTFVAAVDGLFASGLDVLATIRHGDAWAEPYKRHPDAVVFEVGPENRERMPGLLATVFANLEAFRACSPAQRRCVLEKARAYAAADRFVQLGKLFKNACRYVAEGRVSSVYGRSWTVAGDHAVRRVARLPDGAYACDCDLFLGKNAYGGEPGECSHIQAVKIVGD